MTFKWTNILLIVLFLLISCDASFHRNQIVTILEGKNMGTFWRVSIININQIHAKQLQKKIQHQLDADDRLLSSWKNNSELMRFNLSHSTSPLPINEEIADIVTKSLRIGYKTNGAMDITIGSLVNLWGFGRDRQPVKTPTQSEINDARAHSGLHHITVINQYGQQYLQKDIPDLSVDLSTVGEGYAVDHLSALMEQEGIKRYLISVGGALFSRGMNATNQPWKVAIQKPTDKRNAVQAIVNIDGYGISTSGSYRNYYELNGQNISHVIDPRTGRPVRHNLVSVTVIASTSFEADAWDTGLMILGMEKAKEIAQKRGLAVYMIIEENNRFTIWISPQFQKYLTNVQNN